MTALSTRRARPEDAGAAVAVLRDSITKLCVADHGNDPTTLAHWLRNKTVEQFLAWIASAESHVVVAELDSIVCGVGSLHTGGEIRLCYVQPGLQGVGIGRALLAALEAQAKAWRIHTLRLKSTISARSFYEHCGYTAAGPAVPECGA